MLFSVAIVIVIMVICLIEFYDERLWIRTNRSGELKIDENSLAVKIGNTIYTVIGYFDESSNLTAKDKIERLLKKEINKNQ